MVNPNDYLPILLRALESHTSGPPYNTGSEHRPVYSYDTCRVERTSPKGWHCTCGVYRSLVTCEHVLHVAMQSEEGKDLAIGIAAKIKSLIADLKLLQSWVKN